MNLKNSENEGKKNYKWDKNASKYFKHSYRHVQNNVLLPILDEIEIAVHTLSFHTSLVCT